MSENHFVVADPHRLVAFHLIRDFRRWLSAAVRLEGVDGGNWLAIGAPGVVGESHVWVGVQERLAGLRVGEHLWRVLWALHVAVRRQRAPLVRLHARWLGAMVWGGVAARWPRHWRGELLDLLAAVERFNVTETSPGERPRFDEETRLLYGSGEGASDRDVIEVEVGPGFLGALDLLRRDGPDGKPFFTFEPVPRRRRRDEGAEDLRSLGRRGRVQPVFAPALLADPYAGLRLPVRVQRLLQALVRETTLAPVEGKRGRSTPAPPAWVTGALVPDYGGRKLVTCPVLDEGEVYVGFNGKGVRRGLGYRINSPRGWLYKCGYEPVAVRDFLADVTLLSERLGMVAVGVHGDRMVPLDQLVAWANARRSARLEGVHLRLYTRADYAERWSKAFAMPEPVMLPGPAPASGVEGLRDRMDVRGVSLRRLAGAVGVSPAHLSRVFNGSKSPTPELLKELTAAVETVPPPTSQVGGPSGAALAKKYHARGWIAIPQQPGTKRPAVKWKEYQERRPSAAEVAGLFDGRPDAGLMLVLGPTSGVFVIDVDGAEAEQALVERLGGIPPAPRSGRGDPHRFHLFFRHPAGVRTGAKGTPWHPKLEFKGQGGLVVLPPSRHPSGSRYEWAVGASPNDLALPEVPPAVLAALTAVRAKPIKLGGPAPAEPLALPPGLDASKMTREFLTGKYAQASGWNNRLFLAACDLCGRSVPLAKALSLLLKAADPDTPADEDLARATIDSAYSKPRSPGIR